MAVVFSFLLPSVTFHFSAFHFEMAKLVAVKAIALSSFLSFVFGCFASVFLCWGGSILFERTRVTSSGVPSPLSLISRSRWSTISLYGLSSRCALLSIFLTWSGILALMALPINC